MIEIKTINKGAELVSVKFNGIEKMHDGESFWNRHSPVLFPIVGKLKNGKTIINGKEYEMGQHGFARDMEFEPITKFLDIIASIVTLPNASFFEHIRYIFISFLISSKSFLNPKNLTIFSRFFSLTYSSNSFCKFPLPAICNSKFLIPLSLKYSIAFIASSCPFVLLMLPAINNLKVLFFISGNFVLINFSTGIPLLNILFNYMEKRAKQEHIEFCLHSTLTLTEYIPKIILAKDFVHLLSDLFENALIAIRNCPIQMIQIQLYQSQKAFIIEIADSGIPFEVISIINFGFVKYTTHSNTGGSGIGLSIVKKIIEDHGGYIWATSKEGAGTCMHFVIRRYRENENYNSKI